MIYELYLSEDIFKVKNHQFLAEMLGTDRHLHTWLVGV